MSELAASLFKKALATGKDYRSGSYSVENDSDGTVKLFHYGTLIYAFNRGLGRPVYEDRYGGYSVSDQRTINRALQYSGRSGQFFNRARGGRGKPQQFALTRLF